MELETSHFVGKDICNSDIEDIVRYYTEDVYKFLSQRECKTRHAALQFVMQSQIEYIMHKKRTIVLRTVEDGSFMGVLFITYIGQRTVELGIWLAVHLQGKGLGKKVFLQTFEVLREANICKVMTCVDVKNIGSQKLMESCNFEKKLEQTVVTNGVNLNVFVYTKYL